MIISAIFIIKFINRNKLIKTAKLTTPAQRVNKSMGANAAERATLAKMPKISTNQARLFKLKHRILTNLSSVILPPFLFH